MRYVTLVNRTSKVIYGLWDGKRTPIHPGKNSFPEGKALLFKGQHPIMGTEDPYTGDRLYLLGIEENNDPTDPIEQSNKVELLDRAKMDPIAALATEFKTSAGGLYAHEKHAAQLNDTKGGFTTPD